MSEPYELRGFLEALDDWTSHKDPDTAIRMAVLDWIFSRAENPYEGARRQPGQENFWFGRVPNTQQRWETVVCSYWIVEQDHAVRCDQFATLNLPL